MWERRPAAQRSTMRDEVPLPHNVRWFFRGTSSPPSHPALAATTSFCLISTYDGPRSGANERLTSAQWAPLFKLHLGQASSVAELARECRLDAGAMTRTLDRLEAKNLVARERTSSDRRMVNLVLTDQGREAAKAIPVALSKVQNAMLAGLSVDEWEQLKSLLRRVYANAQREQANRQGQQE